MDYFYWKNVYSNGYRFVRYVFRLWLVFSSLVLVSEEKNVILSAVIKPGLLFYKGFQKDVLYYEK